MVYSESPRKGLFRHVWVMGGTCPQKKIPRPEGRQLQDFWEFRRKSGVFFLVRELRVEYPTMIGTYLCDEGSNPETE